MDKSARKKKPGKRETIREVPLREVPNWPLLGLALIGMGISGYLILSAWTGQAVAGCTAAGTGCDKVLNSEWSKLFGMPTALWGFLGYTALAGVAFIKQVETHFKLAWTLALFGVLYSAYLTTISLVELKTTCPYCLTSAALMIVILTTVIYQRPQSLPKFSWRSWLIKTATVGVVVVAAIHLHYIGVWGKSVGSENPRIRALAEHLQKANVKFYGAYWCPHCKEQKELFGASAERLPYVECSPLGPGTSQAAVCDQKGIQGYPTWIIDGQRYEGVLSLSQLEQYSGFKEPSP